MGVLLGPFWLRVAFQPPFRKEMTMSTISGVSGASNPWATLNAQRSQHQAKMFAKVDADSSGGVDQTELSTMLADISKKTGVSLGDSKELFTKMDSNSDGSLSSDELGQGMKDLMPPPPSTMDFAQSRSTGGSGGNQDDLFSKVDTNSDGSVDADELKVLTDKIKSDTGQDVSTQFSKLDTDGDSKLSQTEFEAGRPQPPGGTNGTQSAQGTGGPKGPPRGRSRWCTGRVQAGHDLRHAGYQPGRHRVGTGAHGGRSEKRQCQPEFDG
jgi:Ca2+-binding EF-hand superfamily protein